MNDTTLKKLKIVNETATLLYAVCPFHEEAKGSMAINKVDHRGHRKGFCFCFGCNTKDQLTDEQVDMLTVNSEHVFVSPTLNKDLYQLQLEYFLTEFKEDQAVRLSAKLGINWTLHLNNLGIGWDGQAHTFPMYNGKQELIGIQRRFPNGFKCMVEGSTLGLFIPNNVTAKCLVITEGVSDLATAMELGFQGIAKPNALVGKELAYEWLHNHHSDWQVVIIADNDEAGQKGALELQDYIDSEHCRTRILTPSCTNDLNDYLKTVGHHVTREMIMGEFDAIQKENKV